LASGFDAVCLGFADFDDFDDVFFAVLLRAVFVLDFFVDVFFAVVDFLVDVDLVEVDLVDFDVVDLDVAVVFGSFCFAGAATDVPARIRATGIDRRNARIMGTTYRGSSMPGQQHGHHVADRNAP
jgi:hypothetical protein